MPALEKILIRIALGQARGHRQNAAKLLGWGRNTLTPKNSLAKPLRLAPSREILAEVTRQAMPRWSAYLALELSFFVTVPAQRVELLFQQRRDVSICDMAIHAGITASVVIVIVMANEAVFRRMIRVRKCHRQNIHRTLVVVTSHGPVDNEWRPGHDQQ